MVHAGVAEVWVAAAFTFGKASYPAAAVLLVAYPGWDAVANFADAERNGGLRRNWTQGVNVLVSLITAAAVAVAVHAGDMNFMLAVFGAWAIFAGLLQLATGALRWRRYGAQWAMILSGAPSALAGCLFVKRSLGEGTPTIADITPYAALGAVYLLISGLALCFGHRVVTEATPSRSG